MQRPPGPQGNPIYGNLETFEDDRLGFLKRCFEEYGDIVKFSDRIYILYNPAHVREVLKNTGTTFAIASDLFARRVAEDDTSGWMQHRRLVTMNTKHSHLAAFSGSITKLTMSTVDAIEDKGPFDVLTAMERITAGAITEFVFGEDGRVVPERAASLLDALLVMIGNPFVLPPWVPTPTNLRIRARKREMEQTLLQVIESRKQEPLNDLLSILVTADWPSGKASNEQVSNVLIGTLLAGHRVPAAALAWIWYLLDANRTCEARLHEEVDRVLGNRVPEGELLHDLAYTQAVVKETLRLYPPTWLMEREVLAPTELGGYLLPKGLKLLFSPFVIHRNPTFYPEPDVFRPERWLNEESSEIPPDYAYFPFGGGPRLCLGMNFAMVELMVVTATIARTHALRIQGTGAKVDCRATLLPSGLEARLESRPVAS